MIVTLMDQPTDLAGDKPVSEAQFHERESCGQHTFIHFHVRGVLLTPCKLETLYLLARLPVTLLPVWIDNLHSPVDPPPSPVAGG